MTGPDGTDMSKLRNNIHPPTPTHPYLPTPTITHPPVSTPTPTFRHSQFPLYSIVGVQIDVLACHLASELIGVLGSKWAYSLEDWTSNSRNEC